MTVTPRLTVRLDAVEAAGRVLASQLAAQGMTLQGVTKAVDGEPSVGAAMLAGGAAGLADSRLDSLARLAAQALGPLTLIRPPRHHEVEHAAAIADRVCLSDVHTARLLGAHAPGDPVDILLTVDLGDRREGLLPHEAPAAAAAIAALPGVRLRGVSANFACLSGQLPSTALFRDAEVVVRRIAEHCHGEALLSLGGTCCLQHLRDHHPDCPTEIRSGGGPLYGYDFVSDRPLPGLERRDPVLTAAVLECSRKTPAPPCEAGLDAFGHVPETRLPQTDEAWYALIDLGRRDCEPQGLRPHLDGAWIAGMTADVGVLVVPARVAPGTEVRFHVHYDALVRAVTSPYVCKRYVHDEGATGGTT